MIKAKAFNHAAFRVSDVEKATSFYENVIGLKRIPRPNFGFGGAWYGIGNNALHIISSENRGQKPDPLGAHVAFDVEDFDETKRTLKEMGIELLEGQNMAAGRQLWILDPDGNEDEPRRLSDSTWNLLLEGGFVRALQPARFGGGEVSLVEFVDATIEIARA